MPMNMIIQEKRKELGLTQEIGMFCNELAMLARDNIVSAFEIAEAKLHEFPHNEQLRLNVTNHFRFVIVTISQYGCAKRGT